MSAVDELSELLKEAGAKVTFDPERDNTKPCFSCGKTPERVFELVDMTFGERVVTRPFCIGCRSLGKPKAVTEREVDQKTIHRLLLQLKAKNEENEAFRKALEFYASRPNWHKTVLRKLVVDEDGGHGIRQVNLMQSDQGEAAREVLGRK